jgi:hypothetical protein
MSKKDKQLANDKEKILIVKKLCNYAKDNVTNQDFSTFLKTHNLANRIVAIKENL